MFLKCCVLSKSHYFNFTGYLQSIRSYEISPFSTAPRTKNKISQHNHGGWPNSALTTQIHVYPKAVAVNYITHRLYSDHLKSQTSHKCECRFLFTWFHIMIAFWVEYCWESKTEKKKKTNIIDNSSPPPFAEGGVHFHIWLMVQKCTWLDILWIVVYEHSFLTVLSLSLYSLSRSHDSRLFGTRHRLFHSRTLGYNFLFYFIFFGKIVGNERPVVTLVIDGQSENGMGLHLGLHLRKTLESSATRLPTQCLFVL